MDIVCPLSSPLHDFKLDKGNHAQEAVIDYRRSYGACMPYWRRTPGHGTYGTGAIALNSRILKRSTYIHGGAGNWDKRSQRLDPRMDVYMGERRDYNSTSIGAPTSARPSSSAGRAEMTSAGAKNRATDGYGRELFDEE